MKKILSLSAGITFALALLLVGNHVQAAASWDATGTYTINVNYLSVDYPETLILTQSGTNITGGSLDTIPAGSYFTVSGGTVIGNVINIDAYQGSLLIHMVGTIALDGSMSGTWGDLAPGTRTGTWATTLGSAKNQDISDGKDHDRNDNEDSHIKDHENHHDQNERGNEHKRNFLNIIR